MFSLIRKIFQEYKKRRPNVGDIYYDPNKGCYLLVESLDDYKVYCRSSRVVYPDGIDVFTGSTNVLTDETGHMVHVVPEDKFVRIGYANSQIYHRSEQVYKNFYSRPPHPSVLLFDDMIYRAKLPKSELMNFTKRRIQKGAK